MTSSRRPPPDSDESTATTPVRAAIPASHRINRFKITVLQSAAGTLSWDSSADRCSIGSHESNDVVINDPTVSRFHCEVFIDPYGFRVRDVGSTNGTLLDGTPVMEAWLRSGSTLKLGDAVLRIDLLADVVRLQMSAETRFGALVGTSAAMRCAFSVLERAAATDATILLESETGTGKDLAAEGVHTQSPRRDAPFIAIDCGAVPSNLLESQLFGHERGAFTGAQSTREGAFEEADQGTIFLDEIGELPLDLQPKLLRVLSRREIIRLGSNKGRPVNVRVIAATNRNLRAEVNEGRFRPDLYYRLAVVKVRLPPLREHPEDIGIIAAELLEGLGASSDDMRRLTSDDFVGRLQRCAWSGNVRELRNYLERCLVLDQDLPIPGTIPPDERPGASVADISKPFDEARRLVLDQFEREYLAGLLAAHHGNVSRAAKAARIGRVYFHRLLRRNGLR
ncbi:MAG: sigma 54-interacting transcriptional regulator [Deltaproteobacteria bacterium]|nr:sigma 54-interacting transcriptional regulator [Deltaproteobacteria bacterium]